MNHLDRPGETTHEECEHMFGGGNQGDARQKAHERLREAERAGVKGKDLDTLRSEYNAAVARENSAKGTPGQQRR